VRGLKAQSAVEGARLPGGGDQDRSVFFARPIEEGLQKELSAIAATIGGLHVEASDLVMPLVAVPRADDYPGSMVAAAGDKEHPGVIAAASNEVENAVIVGRLAGLFVDVFANQPGGAANGAYVHRLNEKAQDRFLRLARRGRLLSTACSFLRFSFIETTFRLDRLLL
jgi:hypothetical protein